MRNITIESEADKYRRMFDFPGYRTWSGSALVTRFMKTCVTPDTRSVIDFGCGAGLSALTLSRAGLDVWTTDISDNCLLPEVRERIGGQFIQCALHKLPEELPQCDVGLCGDVMEHLPEKWVAGSFAAIASKAPVCYFQICGVIDVWGDRIGERLHLTIKPQAWWLDKMRAHWDVVESAGADGSTFVLIGRNNKTALVPALTGEETDKSEGGK